MTSGDTTNSRAYLPVPEFLDHNLRHCQKRVSRPLAEIKKTFLIVELETGRKKVFALQ